MSEYSHYYSLQSRSFIIVVVVNECMNKFCADENFEKFVADKMAAKAKASEIV